MEIELESSKCVLAVIDVQEAFRSAVQDFALITSRISIAARGFDLLGVPIIVTEQYPQGLGRTVEELLLSLPDDLDPVEKSTFSACGADEFLKRLSDANADQVVLCGIEAHVCVSQTALDLISRGFQVHLLTDCIASRFEHDKQAGISKMLAKGAVPSSVEMALFELMRDSKHERFKEIQQIIQ
jgi:nicotinamidase-related amidase